MSPAATIAFVAGYLVMPQLEDAGDEADEADEADAGDAGDAADAATQPTQATQATSNDLVASWRTRLGIARCECARRDGKTPRLATRRLLLA